MSSAAHPNIVAVIPARGGSKGIPKKNLSRVGGVPLMGRTIMAARKARLVSSVVVSTDDSEIAGTATRYGARVVMRPHAISGDAASSESALLHVLDILDREGNNPGILVFLQCTAPFTTPDDIDGTISLVLNGRADSAFAARRFNHFLWQNDNNDEAVGVNHNGATRVRRQDLEPQYLEAGSVYAMRPDKLRSVGHRFCGRTMMCEVEASHCFEIDTPEELCQAQMLAHTMDLSRLADRLPNPVSAVVFDFDGVFTDNRVAIAEDGAESVQCSRSDGMGIELLRNVGIPMLVISSETNSVVLARCKKIGLPCRHGVGDKLAALKEWIKENGIDPSHTIFVGNDINDLECLEYVGCAVGPADSHPAIVGSLNIQLQARGGRGAIRELVDGILARPITSGQLR